MVRRGSAVRVRERASRKNLQISGLSCLDRKRLSRAGTRGHDLTFPRWVHRQAGFGLFKLIRTGLSPSVAGRCSARLFEVSVRSMPLQGSHASLVLASRSAPGEQEAQLLERDRCFAHVDAAPGRALHLVLDDVPNRSESSVAPVRAPPARPTRSRTPRLRTPDYPSPVAVSP
jgi:hypothetical protein